MAVDALSLPAGFELRGAFLDPAAADTLLATLWRNTAWRQDDIVLFGRRVRQPRLVGWCADDGVRYGYSGIRLDPSPWPAALDGLRRCLDTHLGTRFNSVLLNAYRDGADSMGWHADDEPELGREPLIASVSLGAVRRFRIRHRHGGHSLGLDLPHGSLLVMSGASQSDWLHALPKTRRKVGLRLNLTFREIRTL